MRDIGFWCFDGRAVFAPGGPLPADWESDSKTARRLCVTSQIIRRYWNLTTVMGPSRRFRIHCVGSRRS